ncbi:calcium-binding protein [Shewanella violacea]|uniref:RTX toxin, putative n=1 Tax=Shewanella violacea (strain JCM 10179 / CIP 106290 / LMG 19151 / DSS12) TaxID=637905 RepID=D4ZGW8_SHEVD|nr:calcium-binding protein [Shewanella violacea]BAJ00917.1 RTX toxin, putative [Shewanella violacea DSS12]
MSYPYPEVVNDNTVHWENEQGEQIEASSDGSIKVTDSKGNTATVTFVGDEAGTVAVDYGNGQISYYDGEYGVSIPLAGGIQYNYDSKTGDYSFDMSVKTPGSKFLGAGMDAKLKGNSSTGVTGMDFSASLTAGVGVANAKLTAGISVGENGKLTGVTSLVLETPLGDIPIAEGEVGLGSLDPNAWLEHSGIFGDTSLGNAYQLLASRGLYLDGMNNGSIPGGMSHQEWLDQLNAAADLKIDSDLQLDANAIEQSMVRRDPLVFDLDGDGIETVSSDAGIIFDHDGDGIKQGTGWVGADDGLLVLDINGNGTIDSGKELFGDNTDLANGEKARNGFAALRDLDSNGDGIIDSNDAVYSQLKIWQDANQDGISQASEMKTLSELDIASINLNDAEYVNQIQEDNLISFTSEYTDSEGNAHSFGTLDFAVNGFHREFNAIAISEEAQGIVDFKGSGYVRDLREAATQNADLLAIYNQFSQATTRAEQDSLIDKLLAEWVTSKGNMSSHTSGEGLLAERLKQATLNFSLSETSDVTQGADKTRWVYSDFYIHDHIPVEYHEQLYKFAETPSGYLFSDNYFSKSSAYLLNNGFTELASGPIVNGSFEASHPTEQIEQMLYILEMFSGRSISATQFVLNGQRGFLAMHFDAVGPVINAYENLRSNIFNSLMFSTRLAHISDSIEIVFDVDGLSYDMTAWEAELIKLIEADPATGVADAMSALDFYEPYISQSDWSQGAFMSQLFNEILPELSPDADPISFFPSAYVEEITEAQLATELEGNKIAATGSDGDDTIRARSGSNSGVFILANNGNDRVFGANGDDYIDGGSGDDYLYGSNGHDQLVGGEGNDILDGGNGDDVLSGGAGNDVLTGGYGNDRFLFGYGDGQDTLSDYDTSTTNKDTLAFGANISIADVTLVKSGNSLVVQLAGSTDQISIMNWFVSSRYQLESFEFADGTVYSREDMLSLLPVESKGTDANDSLTGYTGTDTMYGGAGNDTLSSVDGDDKLYGEAGDDKLTAGNGVDQLFGGEGNDTLDGGYGDDLLSGGAGNDVLTGGYGNDRFLFGYGDGQDTLSDYDTSTTNKDTLVFGANISIADVTLVKSGNSLVVQLAGSTDQISIMNWFVSSRYQLESFEFADGTVYSREDMLSLLPVESKGTDANDSLTGYTGTDTMYGGAGNDTLSSVDGDDKLYGEAGDDKLTAGNGVDQLFGGEGNDTLDGGYGDDLLSGGAGNDVLTGGYGNDRFLFGYGDGQDTLSDYDTSTTNKDTLVFGANISIADVTLVKSGNSLVVQLAGSTDQISIMNWFVSSRYQLESFEFADGTVYSREDMLSLLPVESKGTDANDSLTGYTGTDTMYGGAGNDTLSSVDGDDKLYGEAGDDKLTAGNGVDQLFGGEGNDTLDGGYGDDLLSGGAGNDVLTGGYGNDRFLFGYGDGQDTLSDYDTSTTNKDTLVFGANISIADVTLVKSGNSLVVQLAGSTDQISIMNWFVSSRYQLESFEFADGTVYSREDMLSLLPVESKGTDANDSLTGYTGTDTMYGGAGNDTLSSVDGDDKLYGEAGDDKLTAGNGVDQLFGGEGNDTLDGGYGDDLLSGGAGNDVLTGGYGNDRFLFGYGDGQDTLSDYDTSTTNKDTLVFGANISIADVTLVKSGNSLVVQLAGSTDQISIMNWFVSSRYQLESFEFADGTVYSREDMLSLLPVESKGTDANDSLTGYTGTDTMYGGAGNDTLSSVDGDDKLYGEAGDDKLTAGNGVDQLFGGEGNDTLDGGYGDDLLSGGAGNDVLTGGYGNDRFLFGYGDGQDTLSDYDTSATNKDTLVFGANISIADVTLVKSGNSLVVQLAGSTDQISIMNWFVSSRYQLESFEFADGTVYSREDMLSLLPVESKGTDANDSLTGYTGTDTMYGGAGNDTLSSVDGDDKLYGEAGDDKLTAGNGVDQLFGGEGNDTLDGGYGDDLLSGGAGNDVLTGGYGNDRFLFGYGDGQDTLSDYDTSATNKDTLVFGANISIADVTLVKSGNSLVVQLAGSTDQISIMNWFVSSRYQLESFEFADGTVYSREDMLSLLPVESKGTDANDSLTGYTGTDTMYGGAGNDTLSSVDGDDKLYGEAGDDKLTAGNGVDQLFGGEGNDTLDGGYGDDLLSGGAGNDTLNAGGGSDIYQFGSGSGQDIINNYDSSSSSIDVARFDDVSIEDLWFSRDGNNLQINIIGTDDQVEVNNWYNDTNYQLDQIQVGGSVLLNNQLEQLVSAMASFDVPSNAGSVVTQATKDELQPILVESWQTL